MTKTALASAQKAAPDNVTVTLLKPHQHEGNDYKPNDTITVSSTIADWLITHKIAEGTPATHTKKGA